MICLGSCSEKTEILGKDKVEALRSEAAAYDSGRYFVRNVTTGALEQVFSFCYDELDRQIYLCEGSQAGTVYWEYSNGVELFREENGVSENVASTDETYVKYTRKDPHPYSTGQLLFYIENYIDSSEQTSDDSGNTVYIHRYNAEKLSRAMGMNISEFSAYYAFDAEGKFVYFRQYNVSADQNGQPQTFVYEITIDEVNSITEIEKPLKQ